MRSSKVTSFLSMLTDDDCQGGLRHHELRQPLAEAERVKWELQTGTYRHHWIDPAFREELLARTRAVQENFGVRADKSGCKLANKIIDLLLEATAYEKPHRV